jgi:fermentation-respiration switch protein FrsA (DUF1100 family)
MAKVILFVLLFLGAYAATGVFLALSLDRLMYYPTRGMDAVPSDFGLEAEELVIDASDGTRIHGWYFSVPESRAVLVFLHGNAGNISHRLGLVHQLQRAKADILLFDYRGYGESGGEPRGETPLLDARAVLRVLRSRGTSEGKKIVLFGESIGGTMSLILAEEEGVDGVITLGAFSSVRDVARDMPLYRVFTPLVPDRYNALGAVREMGVPVLFIHGTEDEIIPFSHGERLYAAARGKKERFWVEKGGHNDLFMVAGIEITQRVSGFLDRL